MHRSEAPGEILCGRAFSWRSIVFVKFAAVEEGRMYTKPVCAVLSGMNGNPIGGLQFNHGPSSKAGVIYTKGG